MLSVWSHKSSDSHAAMMLAQRDSEWRRRLESDSRILQCTKNDESFALSVQNESLGWIGGAADCGRLLRMLLLVLAGG